MYLLIWLLTAALLPLQDVHAEIVHDRSEPIFRVTDQDHESMLKSVPGILTDLASMPVTKGVGRAAWWVDASVLAEDIGLELFDSQLDRQRLQLVVLDERAKKWKDHIDNGPPLSDDEKRLLREEFRTMMKQMETSPTRFAGRALTQTSAVRIVAVGTAKHYGVKAVAKWLKGVFRPGKRLKEIVYGGRVVSYSTRRVLQAAWKSLEKRQLEADKAIDAFMKYIAKEILKDAAARGLATWNEAEREERERKARNSAALRWASARWNLAMHIDQPLVAVPVPLVAETAPLPAQVYVPDDPVLKAISVDYQVSRSQTTKSAADDDRPSTSPSYREERFYPREERRSVGREGNAVRQLRSVNIRGWGGN